MNCVIYKGCLCLTQTYVFNQVVDVVQNFKFLNRCLSLLLASYILSLSISRPSLAADDTIFWGEMDLPPISYISGPLKGKGMLNQQLDQILASLPDYHQARIPVSIRRLIVEMKVGHKFCFQALTKNKEREEFIEFVTPTMLTLPFGLITTEKNRSKLNPFLNANGEIDLNALLKSETVTLADFKGRSYSPKIDKTLARYRKDGKGIISTKSGMPDWSLAVKQILHNRIDGLIGKPGEVLLVTKEYNLPSQPLYFPIQGEEKYSLLYAGCAKGDWNVPYIKDLKEAIIKARNTPEFNQAQLDLIPESLHSVYHEFRNSVLSDF